MTSATIQQLWWGEWWRKERAQHRGGGCTSALSTLLFSVGLSHLPSSTSYWWCTANTSTSRIKYMLIKTLINTTENKHYKTNPTLRIKMWFLIYVSEHIMVINILIQTVCKSKPQTEGVPLTISTPLPKNTRSLGLHDQHRIHMTVKVRW